MYFLILIISPNIDILSSDITSIRFFYNHGSGLTLKGLEGAPVNEEK